MTIFKWDSGYSSDEFAIHVDESGEIAALTEKTTPADNDVLVIEDSAATYEKKKVLFSKVRNDPDAIHDNVAGEINAVTTKTTPTTSDVLLIEDAAASYAKKKMLLSAIDDPEAIHDNVAGEISAITLKATPAANDLLLIEDSAASNAKKRITVTSMLGLGATDAAAIHDNVAAEISAITEKTTLVAADLILIEDSAASNAKKKAKAINIDPERAISLTFGDGVNAAPVGAPIRVPIPYALTLVYWFFNASVATVSFTGNVQYYNGSTWSTICSLSAYSGTNTGGEVTTALEKHTTGSQRLLQVNITSGTVKQGTFTLTFRKTGNL